MSRIARFIDSDGFVWRIHEHGDERAAERRVLYFFSRYSTRKLTEFPDDWTSLPDADLELLCRRAAVLGGRVGWEPVMERSVHS